MKKIISLIALLWLGACSSIHDISYEDRNRGSYLFNKKLKSEYSKFFTDQIFKDGLYVYAGPSFISFNNFQLIKLSSLMEQNSSLTSYQDTNGTRHEYLNHVLQAHWEGRDVKGVYKVRLGFDAIFSAFGQIEKVKYELVTKMSCKKDVDCSMVPDIDFFHNPDPYNFEFSPLDEDIFVTGNIELNNFSDSEATAISNRMIYKGMSQKAAELAIGSNKNNHYIQGYYDVVFQNNMVSDFKYGYRYDLPIFRH